MAKGTASGLPTPMQRKIDSITRTVLKDMKPTKVEIAHITRYVNDLMGRLKKAVPRDVEIIVAGSVARGTQMRGSHDIDIFLLYPKKLKEEEMEKRGLEVGKKIVNKDRHESYQIKYAEHPYVKLILNDVGITADIVPAFKINHASERVTAVDRTQLHNKFIMSSLSSRQKDEVIVLKSFLKSHGIYGAGAEVEGFSGYLCELLVHTFGSFTGTLTHFSNMHLPVIIDPLKRQVLRGRGPDIAQLTKKFSKDFVVVDPTDENRNVAAVVSDQALARLVLLSRIFLKRPTLDLFYGPKFSDTFAERKLTHMRKELGLDIHLLHFRAPEIAEDIIWQQARRLEGRIHASLTAAGFPPAICFEHVHGRDAIIAFFVDGKQKQYTLVQGPSVYMGQSAEKFMAAHPKAVGMLHINDKLMAVEEARIKTAREALEASLKGIDNLPSYIKRERIKVYANKIPEDVAKLLYVAFIKKTTL